MPLRGLRGATIVDANTSDAILAATRELLHALIDANQLHAEEIASVIFSIPPDLDAVFPARAARELGWTHVALLDLAAPRVANDLPHCIRVLIHWNTEKSQAQIQHVYLRGAKSLRPDLVNGADQ